MSKYCIYICMNFAEFIHTHRDTVEELSVRLANRIMALIHTYTLIK